MISPDIPKFLTIVVHLISTFEAAEIAICFRMQKCRSIDRSSARLARCGGSSEDEILRWLQIRKLDLLSSDAEGREIVAFGRLDFQRRYL